MTDGWLSKMSLKLVEQNGVVYSEDRGPGRINPESDEPMWSQQHIENHFHAFDELTDIPLEVALMVAWRGQFESQLPQHSFVIEIEPIETVTWYQYDGVAEVSDGDWDYEIPYELRGTFDFTEFIGRYVDDLTWEEFESAFKVCLACQLDAGFGEPFMDPMHRGIQWKQCKGCGRIAYNARRTVREVFWASKTD